MCKRTVKLWRLTEDGRKLPAGTIEAADDATVAAPRCASDSGDDDMAGVLRPIDLKEISAKAEMAKMEAERQHKRKKEQLAAELRDAFMARDVLPDAIDRVNRAVRVAADQTDAIIAMATAILVMTVLWASQQFGVTPRLVDGLWFSLIGSAITVSVGMASAAVRSRDASGRAS